MAYMYVIGACFGCGKLFSFNADHVPSVRIDLETGQPSPTGSREPVCADCIARANPERVANGLEPIVPHPLAYEPEPVA